MEKFNFARTKTRQMMRGRGGRENIEIECGSIIV